MTRWHLTNYSFTEYAEGVYRVLTGIDGVHVSLNLMIGAYVTQASGFRHK